MPPVVVLANRVIVNCPRCAQVDLWVKQVIAIVEDAVILEPTLVRPLVGSAPKTIDLHEATTPGHGISFVVAVEVASRLAPNDVRLLGPQLDGPTNR